MSFSRSARDLIILLTLESATVAWAADSFI
jgi:hypothetical protein